jgi:hypothetical protein
MFRAIPAMYFTFSRVFKIKYPVSGPQRGLGIGRTRKGWTPVCVDGQVLGPGDGLEFFRSESSGKISVDLWDRCLAPHRGAGSSVTIESAFFFLPQGDGSSKEVDMKQVMSHTRPQPTKGCGWPPHLDLAGGKNSAQGHELMSVINSRCESMHQQRSLRVVSTTTP